MTYLVLDFKNDLSIMKITDGANPAYVFAGKCKVWFAISKNRGVNIANLIHTFVYGAKHEAISYFIRLWNITLDDCLILCPMLDLFIDSQDGMWFVSKVNVKHINGSKRITGAHSNAFYAMCSYYRQMNAAGYNYSLIPKHT